MGTNIKKEGIEMLNRKQIKVVLAALLAVGLSLPFIFPNTALAAGTLRVTVLKPDGTPMTGLEVDLWTAAAPPPDPPGWNDNTNDDGVVVFTVEAGDYLIGFNAIGWPEEYVYPQQPTPVTVVEGEVTEKTIMLQGTSHLLISEVFYDTPGTDGDEEWIEIFNPTSSTIDLSYYKVGDAEEEGKNEGMYQFPPEASIPPGGVIVVALKATGFNVLYGFNPDYEVTATDATVPDMIKYSAWATGSIALSNSGDEVLLLDGSDNPVDVVVFEGGSYPGVIPHPGVATSHSLERVPADQDTDDCSVDFTDQASPTPRDLPTYKIYLPLVMRNASTP